MNIYNTITERIPIDKGWSGDQKFRVTTTDKKTYLLRISPMDRLDRKAREFENMRNVARLGIPMCLPLEFGTCDEGVFSSRCAWPGAGNPGRPEPGKLYLRSC